MRDPHRHYAQPRSVEPADGTPSAELADLSDRTLLDRMRAGDDAAFGALYCRHADAVRAFAARTTAAGADADDLTAEAFFRVLQTVRNGSGPVEYIRAYLITVTRRVAAEWTARRFDIPVSDEELVRRSEPGLDSTLRGAEHSLITTAFTSLPERWRTVLWRVEVEGQRPAAVARYLGLSATATAALARRARNGLRAAYLQAHLSTGGGTACWSITQKLGAYTAGGLRGSEMRRIRTHLADCPSCRSLHAELSEVCSGLRANAGLLVLPAAAVGLAGQAVAGTASSGSAVAASLTACGAKISRLAILFARAKLGLAAASATMVGVLGVGFGPLLGDSTPAIDQGLDGNHGNVIAVSPQSTTSSPSTETRSTETRSTEPQTTKPQATEPRSTEAQSTEALSTGSSRQAPAGTGGSEPARVFDVSHPPGPGRDMATHRATTAKASVTSSTEPTASTSVTATDGAGESAGNEFGGPPSPVRTTSSTPPDVPRTRWPLPSYSAEPTTPEPGHSSVPVTAE